MRVKLTRYNGLYNASEVAVTVFVQRDCTCEALMKNARYTKKNHERVFAD